MTRTPTAAVLLVALACALPAACLRNTNNGPPSPTRAGLNTADLIDPPAQVTADQERDATDVTRLADRARRDGGPAPARRSVLVLSGGGTYGAYTAGVLVGWSETGCRPRFDVVTGISTGALIAPFAFAGPRYDALIAHFYTGTEGRDLFRVRPLRAIRSESLADNTALARTLDEIITPEFLREVGAWHARGRRLYVGTTELESRRPVVWDLGAVAYRGTPADLDLFRKVLLASAAVPGFFPPVRIPVEVDGRWFEERHVDGGVTQTLFFRPPYLSPELRSDPGALRGTDVYVIVAGKLYPDPEPTRARVLAVARSGVTAGLSAQTRGELARLYAVCALAGMNFHLAAIPADYPALRSATEFDQAEMVRLFEAGRQAARSGVAWRSTPPGAEPGEGTLERSGTQLNEVPQAPVPWPGMPVLPAPFGG